MPSMRFVQTTVTQDFGIEPTCLAAEGSLYDITGFCDETIALQLPSRQWVVPCGLILDTVFDTARLQSIAMFLAAILNPPFRIPTGSILNSSNPEYAGRLLHPTPVYNALRSLSLSNSSLFTAENSLSGCGGLHRIPKNSCPSLQCYCFRT